jgi:hypothetical protein
VTTYSLSGTKAGVQAEALTVAVLALTKRHEELVVIRADRMVPPLVLVVNDSASSGNSGRACIKAR